MSSIRLGGSKTSEGHPTKIAGLYDLEETLGRGHFAVVKLARHVFTGEKVAVKVIDKTKLDPVSQDHLYQEVRCMKLVQHPNVVRLYEVIDTNSKLYLILELGDGGDLYDYIMKHDAGLSESFAREYFAQIVRAISFCHKLHVVHRDLKPENVVFFERLGVVKLTDFGFSNRFNPGQKLETSCGSLAYSAPEILLGDSYDAPAVDVWSLGVILYMLVAGQAPFQEANDSETLTMIMDVKYKVPQHVTDECKRLIGRMLVREPEKRATLEEIAADPWLAPAMHDDNVAVPLVSRETVTEEDHNFIITKMVNGKIASKEEILEALDKDEYNHITATYYLLAERKLRLLRQPKKQQPILNTPIVNVERCQDLEQSTSNTRVNQALLTMSRNPGDVAQRTRKCSIVTEEEDDDEDEQSGSSQDRRGSRSEGKLNLAVQELRRECLKLTEANTAPTPLQLSNLPHSSMLVKPLPSSCSPSIQSSQLGLDGISEEGGGITGGTSSNPPRSNSGFIQKRNTFRKTRTASVSSSDASDEDETRSRRGSTKSLHRNSRHDPGGGGNNGDNNGDGGHSNGGSGSQHGSDKGNNNDPSNKDTTGSSGGGSGTFDSGDYTTKRQHGHSTRHKRRTGETRLRESQSLNRITEVQECDGHLGTLHTPNETINQPTDTNDSAFCFNCDSNQSTKVNENIQSEPNNNQNNVEILDNVLEISGAIQSALEIKNISQNEDNLENSEYVNDENKENHTSQTYLETNNNNIKLINGNKHNTGNHSASLINVYSISNDKSKNNSRNVNNKYSTNQNNHNSNNNNQCMTINKNKKQSKNTLISRYLYLQRKLVLPLFGGKKSTNSHQSKELEGRLYKAKSCSEVEKSSCTKSTAAASSILMRHHKCCTKQHVKDNLECAAIAVTASIVNIGPNIVTNKKCCSLC